MEKSKCCEKCNKSDDLSIICINASCPCHSPSVAKLPQKEESKCTCLKGEYGIFQTCDNCFVKHINSTPLEECGKWDCSKHNDGYGMPCDDDLNVKVSTPPITDWEKEFGEKFMLQIGKQIVLSSNTKAEDIKSFIRHQKELSTKEERKRIIRIIWEGVEKYKVSKEATKVNKLGADYIFVYDLKTFIIKNL